MQLRKAELLTLFKTTAFITVISLFILFPLILLLLFLMFYDIPELLSVMPIIALGIPLFIIVSYPFLQVLAIKDIDFNNVENRFTVKQTKTLTISLDAKADILDHISNSLKLLRGLTIKSVNKAGQTISVKYQPSIFMQALNVDLTIKSETTDHLVTINVYPLYPITISNGGISLKTLKYIYEALSGSPDSKSILSAEEIQLVKERSNLIIEPASMGKRILAFIIDRSIYLILIILGSIFIAFGVQDSNWYNIISSILGIVIVTFGFIFDLFRDSFSGQSLGKILLGLQVVNYITGKPAKGWSILRRNVVLYIPYAVLIELFVASVNKEHRRMGDRYAETIVTKFNKQS